MSVEKFGCLGDLSKRPSGALELKRPLGNITRCVTTFWGFELSSVYFFAF